MTDIAGWYVINLPSGETHVVPALDMKPHLESTECWCGPTDDDGVLVHHSFDGREHLEQTEGSA